MTENKTKKVVQNKTKKVEKEKNAVEAVVLSKKEKKEKRAKLILETKTKKVPQHPSKKKQVVVSIKEMNKLLLESKMEYIWNIMQMEQFFPEFPFHLFQLLLSCENKKKFTEFQDITKERLEFLGDRFMEK